MLTNNDIVKKIAVAFEIKKNLFIHIVSLANYTVTKSEVHGIFVSPAHKNFRHCKDELLEAFLDGLIIYMRDREK